MDADPHFIQCTIVSEDYLPTPNPMSIHNRSSAIQFLRRSLCLFVSFSNCLCLSISNSLSLCCLCLMFLPLLRSLYLVASLSLSGCLSLSMCLYWSICWCASLTLPFLPLIPGLGYYPSEANDNDSSIFSLRSMKLDLPFALVIIGHPGRRNKL